MLHVYYYTGHILHVYYYTEHILHVYYYTEYILHVYYYTETHITCVLQLLKCRKYFTKRYQ